MAARLEGLSSGADVIISEVIYNDSDVCNSFASGELEASPFDMTLKGFEDQVQLWRVKRKLSENARSVSEAHAKVN
jgi:class 3 adenylate cyclase